MRYAVVFHAENENIAWLVQDYLIVNGIDAEIVVDLHNGQRGADLVDEFVKHLMHPCDVMVPLESAGEAMTLLKRHGKEISKQTHSA